MVTYTVTFSTVAQVSGKPAKETRKFVTAHTVPEDLLADVVSDFAEGHEGVKLISSDGSDVDISLKDVVKGLQEDDSDVPGISQDSTAKTALILVGRPLRPKATQQGVFAHHSTAMAAPGMMPAAQVCKRGRMQSTDPAKSQLGQKQSDQLSLQAANLMRPCAQALCSREAEAPWPFHPLAEQPLKHVTITGLLLMPGMADVTYPKLEKALGK